ETGQLLLEKALGKYPKVSVALLVEKMGYGQLDDLYKPLGQGEISLRQVQHVIEQLLPEPSTEMLIKEVIRRPKSLSQKPLGSLLVEGQTGVLTALAKCCKPAPPDEIDGFVTKGRGISVHRSTCFSYKKMAEQSPARRISVAWTFDEMGVFPIEIEVFALEHPHLIRDLSDTLTREKARVIGINKVSRETKVQLRFTVEVKQIENLGQILSHLVECKGVTHALRV
ncbi:MAG: GTP pyrophosphokinase, partial [Neisseriaceae bacterium]|nr:GTP pyrophosphokinase [Neisseriaceae bacterium]